MLKLVTEQSIFDFINPDDCNQFSKLGKVDLKIMLKKLSNYYLELRDDLKLSDNVTFGTEIEFEQAQYAVIYNRLRVLCNKKDYDWNIKPDSSLRGGGEVVSPILRDTNEDWQQLKEICEMLQNNNAIAGNRCGGHIHLGTQIIGMNKELWLNLFKLWTVYEKVIYRFAYGEKLNYRETIFYARPIGQQLFCFLNTIFKYRNDAPSIYSLDKVCTNRNLALNFDHMSSDELEIGNTVEVRCPNGTLDPVVWQNNINFFAKLFLYSQSDNYNDDIVAKRLRKYQREDNTLPNYDRIYKSEALELCDMLFDNNLDKLYFLRQYFKSFEVAKGEDLNVPAKEFTKK